MSDRRDRSIERRSDRVRSSRDTGVRTRSRSPDWFVAPPASSYGKLLLMDATLIVLRATEMIVGVRMAAILLGEMAVAMVAMVAVMGAAVDVEGMVIVVCWDIFTYCMAITNYVKANLVILVGVVAMVAEAAGDSGTAAEGAGVEGTVVRISPLARAHHCQNQSRFPKAGKRLQL